MRENLEKLFGTCSDTNSITYQLTEKMMKKIKNNIHASIMREIIDLGNKGE